MNSCCAATCRYTQRSRDRSPRCRLAAGRIVAPGGHEAIGVFAVAGAVRDLAIPIHESIRQVPARLPFAVAALISLPENTLVRAVGQNAARS